MGRKLKGAHVGLLGAEALRPFILFITRDSGSRVVVSVWSVSLLGGGGRVASPAPSYSSRWHNQLYAGYFPVHPPTHCLPRLQCSELYSELMKAPRPPLHPASHQCPPYLLVLSLPIVKHWLPPIPGWDPSRSFPFFLARSEWNFPPLRCACLLLP